MQNVNFPLRMPFDISAFEVRDQPETQVFKLDVQTYQFIMDRYRGDMENKPYIEIKRLEKDIQGQPVINTTFQTMDADFEPIYNSEIKQQQIQSYTTILFTLEDVQEYYQTSFPLSRLIKYLESGFNAVILGVGSLHPLASEISAAIRRNSRNQSKNDVLDCPPPGILIKHLAQNQKSNNITIVMFSIPNSFQTISHLISHFKNMEGLVLLIQFSVQMQVEIFNELKEKWPRTLFLEGSSLICQKENEHYESLRHLTTETNKLEKNQVKQLLIGNIEHTTNLLKLQILCTFLLLQKERQGNFIHVHEILKQLKQLYKQHILVQDTQIVQAMNNFTSAETPLGRVTLIEKNAESFKFLGNSEDIDHIIQNKFDNINFSFR